MIPSGKQEGAGPVDFAVFSFHDPANGLSAAETSTPQNASANVVIRRRIRNSF